VPDLAADVEAVHPRQHDVEDDQIVRALGRTREAGLAVARGLDAVAFAAEPIAERQPQAGFVLDEQDARADHDGIFTVIVVPCLRRHGCRRRWWRDARR
jgi:hypothetical protein